MVPFCPHLLQNLSPIAGILSSLTLTLANLYPSSSLEINVLSTYPNCPFFTVTDSSILPLPSLETAIFPITTNLSCNLTLLLIIP